jgi:hypothetical protein
VTRPQGPPPSEPSTDVVEFGGSRHDDPRPPGAGWLRRALGRREPRVSWLLAGLGSAAVFGSLVGEWATATYDYPGGDIVEPQPLVIAIGAAGNWGAAWMIGVLVLAAMVGIGLAGPPRQRAAARVAGLAVSAALLVVMVAAAMEVGTNDQLDYGVIFPQLEESEVSLERGLLATYLALALIAAALWLAPGHPRTSPRPGTGQPGAPAGDPGADLTVRPAEPFVHPTSDHEWR